MGVFLGTRYVTKDPTAGVTLMPRMVTCPRCGIVKGRLSHVRPGLCRDCTSGMTAAERELWRVA